VEPSNEYLKTCPYCSKQFEAGHLSKKYCCETCKRRAFRKKKQDERKEEKLDKDQCINNNAILARLYRNDESPFEQKELLKAGYNESYAKDWIRYKVNMLVTYNDYYIEVLKDDRVIIHKKL
jgi:hypothetical protein